MLFRRRKPPTDPGPAPDTTTDAMLEAARVAHLAGGRVVASRPGVPEAVIEATDAEAVARAAGWTASGVLGVALLREPESLRALATTGPQVTVVPAGDAEPLLRADGGVLVTLDEREVGPLVHAALRTLGETGRSVVVVLPPSGRAEPMGSVPPLEGPAPVVDPGRPEGFGATPDPLGLHRMRAADHVFGEPALAAALDQALSTFELTPFSRRDGQGLLAVGCWGLDHLPERYALVRIRRLLPPPRVVSEGSGDPAVVLLPATPGSMSSWADAARLRAAVGSFAPGLAPSSEVWMEIRDQAHRGHLPRQFFAGGLRRSDGAVLPPETHRRNALFAGEPAAILESGRPADQVPHAPDTLPPGVAGREALEVFWREQGHLLRAGRSEELLPHPKDTSCGSPALTAALLREAPQRELAPTVLTQRCTGCGTCWALCPEAAIRPRSLVIEATLRAAASELRPAPELLPRVLGPLVKATQRLVQSDGLHQYPTLEQATREALERLLAKAALSDDEAAVVREDVARLAMPEAPMLRVLESRDRVMLLGIDPDRCNGCGMCSESCPEDALEMRAAGDPAVVYDRFSGVGEADPADLQELAVARDAQLPLLNAPNAVVPFEAAVGLRLVLRLVFSAVFCHAAQRRRELEGMVAEARAGIEEASRRVIGRATQINDFDRLSQNLEDMDSLEDVLRAGGADELEAPRLRELADARLLLGQLARKLDQAPCAVLFGEGIPLPPHPANPFGFPWMVARDRPGTQAQGMAEGLSGRAMEMAGMLSRARGAWRNTGEMPAPQELIRRMDTPVMVVVDRLTSDLHEKLVGDTPLLVVELVSDLTRAPEEGLAIGLTGRAFVAQASPARPDHLAECVRHALDRDGPSLVRIHVPLAPAESVLADAREGLEAWPLFAAAPIPEGPKLTIEHLPGPGANSDVRLARLLERLRSGAPWAPRDAVVVPPAGSSQPPTEDPVTVLVESLLARSGFAPGTAEASRALRDLLAAADPEEAP